MDALVFHFNGPLLYVNSEHFKENALKLLSQMDIQKPQHFILDASSINHIDKTGALALCELSEELTQEYVTLVVAAGSGKRL